MLENVEGVKLCNEMLVNELVYADDTLLIDMNGDVLQAYMNCIAAVGQEYGMSFN